MSWRKPLLLLAAVVLAGVVAYSLSRKPTTEQAEQEAGRLLPDLKPDHITAIEVGTGAGRVVAERDGPDGRWRITAPIALRADQWAVDAVLRACTAARTSGKRIPLAGRDPDAYGFGDVRARVSLRAAGPQARSWTVQIGGPVDVGELVYARRDDEDFIRCIDLGAADAFDVALTDVRSKHLVDEIRVDGLTSMLVAAAAWNGRPAFTAECVRQGNAWILPGAAPRMACADEIRELADAAARHELEPDDFVTDSPARAAEFGLDDPDLKLTFRPPAGERTIAMSRRVEGEREVFYAMNAGEPAIVRVPRELFDFLRRDATALRERSMAAFRPKDVAAITLTRAGHTLTLRAFRNVWLIAGDIPAPADAAVVSDIIFGMRDGRVSEFVDDAPADLKRYALDTDAALDLVFADATGHRLARAQFGAASADGRLVYARRPGWDALLGVDAAPFIADLRAGRLGLLDRLVLDDRTDCAVMLATAWNGERFRCERLDPTGKWRLTEPVSGSADEGAVAELLRAVGRLRVARFAAEAAGDLTQFGLDKPHLNIEIRYDLSRDGTADVVRDIAVGAQCGDAGRFARIEGDPRVLVLDATTVRTMKSVLASRLICRTEGISRLELVRGEDVRTFARDDRINAWLDGSGRKTDEAARGALEKVRGLLRRFSGIRIAAYTGEDRARFGLDEPSLIVRFTDRRTAGKRIEIGRRASDGDWFVRGSASSFVLVAADADVRKLLAPLGTDHSESD